MKMEKIIPVLVITAILLVVSMNITIAAPHAPPKQLGVTSVIIKLDKGWNLVGLSGKLVEFKEYDRNLNVFLYLNKFSKFLHINTALETLNTDFPNYFSQSAFFVYSSRSEELAASVILVELSEITLHSEWNVVSVQPFMLNKQINEITGSCSAFAAYRWDVQSQSWQQMRSGETFSSLGGGVAIYVKESCKLYAASPPQLPQQTATQETAVIIVDTSPAKGNIFVDRQLIGIAPQTVRLAKGIHNLSFDEITGYQKPDDVIIDIQDYKFISVEYLRKSDENSSAQMPVITPLPNYELIIITNVKVPIRIDTVLRGGTVLRDDGTYKLSAILQVGRHTVEYMPVAGYLEPGKDSIALNSNITLIRTYLQGEGGQVGIDYDSGVEDNRYLVTVKTTPVNGHFELFDSKGNNFDDWTPKTISVPAGKYTLRFWGAGKYYKTPGAAIPNVNAAEEVIDIQSDMTIAREYALTGDYLIKISSDLPVWVSIDDNDSRKNWGDYPIKTPLELKLSKGPHKLEYKINADNGWTKISEERIDLQKDTEIAKSFWGPEEFIVTADTCDTGPNTINGVCNNNSNKSTIRIDGKSYGIAPVTIKLLKGFHYFQYDNRLPKYSTPADNYVEVNSDMSILQKYGYIGDSGVGLVVIVG